MRDNDATMTKLTEHSLLRETLTEKPEERKLSVPETK